MSSGPLEATVKARVAKDTVAELVKQADKLDRSVSDVVRIAIREYLERQGKRQ